MVLGGCTTPDRIDLPTDEERGGSFQGLNPVFSHPLTDPHEPHNAGITKEEMAQPAFQGLAALNFPELHEESIPELNFFRACHKMMTVGWLIDGCRH